MKRPFQLTVLTAAAIALTSCGGSAPKLSGITKLIRPGGQKSEVADSIPAKPQDPLARAVQVAWTSARAKKCGFYFHPQQLRASLVSFEQKQDASPEHLQSVNIAYDKTHDTISKKLQAFPLGEYCSDKVVEEVRKDLNRHLAGDFSPTVRKEEKKKKKAGIFARTDPSEIEPLNREKIFYPKSDF